jgi:hypothetical protein
VSWRYRCAWMSARRRAKARAAENTQLRDVLAEWIIRAAELEYELQVVKGNPS